MEENSDKFVIQLLIGKQVYPITVRRDQEEVYRKASRMINEKLARYEQSYPNLAPERYSAVALLVTLLCKCCKCRDKRIRLFIPKL